MAEANVNISLGAKAEAYLRAFDEAEKRTNTFTNRLAKAAALTATAFVAIKTTVFDSLEAFAESEKATKQLEQALFQQGIEASKVMETYNDLAEATALVAGVDDDAVKAAFAKTQAFLGNIPISKELTEAALDLAAATGKDLDEAMEKIARSATTSTNALAKNAIVVTESFTPQERLAQIIGQVETRFGGQAKAAQGVGTAMANLKNAFGEIQESMGEALAPAAKAVAEALTGILTAVKENDRLVKFVSTVALAAGSVLGLVAGFAAAASTLAAFKGLMAAVGISIGALGGPITLAILALGGLVAYWDKAGPYLVGAFRATFAFIREGFLGLATVLNGARFADLGMMTAGLEQMKGSVKAAKDAMTAELEKPIAAPTVDNSGQLEKNRQNAEALQAQEAEHSRRVLEIQRNSQEISQLQAEGGSAALIALKRRENEILKEIDDLKGQAGRAALEKQLQDNFRRQQEQVAIDIEQRRIFEEEILAKNEEFQALTEAQKDKFFQDAGAKERERIQTGNAAQVEAAAKRAEIQVAANNAFLQEKIRFGETAAKINQALNSQEVQGFKQATGDLIQLTQSKNATLKTIGKAAAVSNIAISTAESAMNIFKGFSAIPFIGQILGIAGAAAAIAFGAERTRQVLAAADGGLVSGGVPGRDSVPALLMPGELVTPAKNFDEVVGSVRAARSGQDMGAVVGELQALRGDLAGGVRNVTINGDLLTDDVFIDRLISKISDRLEFGNARLAGVNA